MIQLLSVVTVLVMIVVAIAKLPYLAVLGSSGMNKLIIILLLPTDTVRSLIKQQNIGSPHLHAALLAHPVQGDGWVMKTIVKGLVS